MVVGVSGGPDSSALLLLLNQLAAEFGYRCEAAYFDHQIRPQPERSAELDTVSALTGTLGLTLHRGSAPVLELAREQGRSVEEAARHERYRFLSETAAACGAAAVAVGHTADDQVETILLHVLRGSGLRGLAGMRPRTPWPFGSGPWLIRPLLGVTHAETQAYCGERGIQPHQDSQNLSPAYARNRVRHELLPLLESFNPRFRRALLRLAAAASAQVDLLAALSAQLNSGAGPAGSSQRRLSVAALRTLPPAVRSDALAEAYAQFAGDRNGLTARHISALGLLLETAGERTIDLPAGTRGRRSGNALRFERQSSAAASDPPAQYQPAQDRMEAVIEIPGCLRFGAFELTAEMLEPGVECQPGPLCAVFAAEVAALSLRVRGRQPGDRLAPAGLAGNKKLQDLMVDAKIPRSQRDAIPVVCLGSEIVWVVGVRADARACVRTPSVRRVALVARHLDEDRAATLA